MSAKGRRRGRWGVVRHIVQVCALALFAAPVLLAGWNLFGLNAGGELEVATPAQLAFFGTLSSTTISGVQVADPFAVLEVVCASKSLEIEWLLAALPVLIVYGLVRGRAFCGWICPVNLLLELLDALRRRLPGTREEAPVPRHAKLYVAAAVLALSAITSVPAFETFSPVGAVSKGIVLGSLAGLWTLAAIVVAEMFWGRRVWCRALCPLGGFYEALGRTGQVNIRIDHDACIGCKACTKACLCDPVILEPALAGEDSIVRAGDCMACGSCIDACPVHALSFRLGRPRKPASGARAEEVEAPAGRAKASDGAGAADGERTVEPAAAQAGAAELPAGSTAAAETPLGRAETAETAAEHERADDALDEAAETDAPPADASEA